MKFQLIRRWFGGSTPLCALGGPSFALWRKTSDQVQNLPHHARPNKLLITFPTPTPSFGSFGDHPLLGWGQPCAVGHPDVAYERCLKPSSKSAKPPRTKNVPRDFLGTHVKFQPIRTWFGGSIPLCALGGPSFALWRKTSDQVQNLPHHARPNKLLMKFPTPTPSFGSFRVHPVLGWGQPRALGHPDVA